MRNHFDASKAMRELKPWITEQYAWKSGSLAMNHPLVREELAKIMDRKDRGAKKFLDTVWGWVERFDAMLKSGEPMSKADVEAGLTAARLLGKGYINEKGGDEKSRPVDFRSLGDLTVLTGKKPKETQPVAEVPAPDPGLGANNDGRWGVPPVEQETKVN